MNDHCWVRLIDGSEWIVRDTLERISDMVSSADHDSQVLLKAQWISGATHNRDAWVLVRQIIAIHE